MSLPQGMMRDLEDAFFLFAYDDSRKITHREAGPVIRSIGLNPTEAELKDITNEISRQPGGNIDAPGLARLLSGRVRDLQTTADDLREAFQVFDKNGDGLISVGDMRHSLCTLGERLPDEIVDEIVREVDQDGMGQINYNDVVNILLGGK